MGNNFLQAAQQFLGNVVQNNEEGNLINAPWRQAAISAIMSGDQLKGQELAQNIMQSYGFSSPQEALQQGMKNLGIGVGNNK